MSRKRKTIPSKQIKEFLQWLDYEHCIIECYGYELTPKDLKDSHRCFSKLFGELVDAMGYKTLEELILDKH